MNHKQVINPSFEHASEDLALWMNYRQVCRLYGIGSSTLYRWIAEGRFPAGQKLGPHSTRWHRDTLTTWEQERAA